MLEGVSDVFKHFQASKLASAALLVTSAGLVFGQKFLSIIPNVPDGWSWLVWSVMLFTGFQCVCWVLSSIFDGARRSLKWLGRTIFPVRLADLSDVEQFVMTVAADNGGNFFDEHAERYSPRHDPVAISLAEGSLVKKGLMQHGMMTIMLTEDGKRLCVKHQLYSRIIRRPDTGNF